MSKRYPFNEATVVQAMKLYKKGKTPDEIIKELELPNGTTGRNLIGYWRKRSGIKAVSRYKDWGIIKKKVQ